MRFSIKHIHIKSKWFDYGDNKYKRLGADGFYLYLNLFRYYIDRQETEYTFLCPLSFLRKDTGYTSHKVIDLLRLLVKEKVIRIVNLSRWDRLLDEKGKLVDDKVLVIEAIDKPQTYRDKNSDGEEVDIPCDPKEENFYISLDMPLIQHYIDIGLSERYFGLHCLMSKYSNGTENKSWMTIENMASVLGFGDKTINKMIHEMNRKYVLYTRYLKTDKKAIGKNSMSKDGSKFEHFLLRNYDLMGKWMETYKDSIDKNIKKWDKKKG